MSRTAVAQPELEWSVSELESAFTEPSFEPTLLSQGGGPAVEADWAVVAAVAAVLAIAVAVVAYICGVCGARSFNACYSAVISYWGRGC